MAVSITESFEVDAPPDRVWSFLIDPAQVVQCLPGAELLEQQDERTFVGRMRVKVGPVTAAFRGKARFDEVDAAARRVRMSGEGQDTGGSGTAKMTMTSEIVALPNGGSRISVQSDVDVMGKLAQFGRGLMEEVSKQMFKQFATCVQGKLAAATPSARSTATPTATPTAAAEPPKPMSALPLLWAALIAWIQRLLRRT